MSNSLFSYETLAHAVAGATGSVVGMATFYPLDVIRSRVQVEDSPKLKGSPWELLVRLANEEGIETLYKGLFPVLQSLSVSNFVYFYSFHALRKNYSNNPSALNDLLFGSLAACLNVLVTTPLWVVNSRMKLQNTSYNSLIDGLLDISRREGIGALWSGTFPSLLLVSNPAIQFMVYESLKRDLLHQDNLSGIAAFLAGAVAKGVATTITYPLQLVQARLRVGTNMKPLIQEAKSRPLSMFRGLETKLLQTVMTAALMFVMYEKIVKVILTIMRLKIKHH